VRHIAQHFQTLAAIDWTPRRADLMESSVVFARHHQQSSWLVKRSRDPSAASVTDTVRVSEAPLIVDRNVGARDRHERMFCHWGHQSNRQHRTLRYRCSPSGPAHRCRPGLP
jgi:hypothetical protein